MKIKKLWVMGLGLVASASILAGAPTQLPVDVVAPADNGGFFVGVTGMYAKPSETGLGDANNSWQYASVDTITSLNKPIKSSQQWEVGFDVGYNFPNSSNSLEFSYFQLRNSKHFLKGTEGVYSLGSIFFPDITLVDPSSINYVANSHLKYKLNQYDLFLGHQMNDVIGNFSLKPTFGLRFAELTHDFPFAVPGYVDSKFNGVGPTFGLDGNFALWHSGFNIVGHVDGALLDGNVESKSFIFLSGTNLYYKSPDRNRIVPTLTARLGADYEYVFANQSSLTLEVGYEAAEYFNGIDLIRGDTNASDSLGTAVHTPRITSIDTNDFAYQGPYATLTYSLG
jgi:hypothetical protein